MVLISVVSGVFFKSCHRLAKANSLLLKSNNYELMTVYGYVQGGAAFALRVW